MRAIFTEKSRTRDFIQHSSPWEQWLTHNHAYFENVKSESTEILEISFFCLDLLIHVLNYIVKITHYSFKLPQKHRETPLHETHQENSLLMLERDFLWKISNFHSCGSWHLSYRGREGCDFQMDLQIGRLYLKVTHPLCNILVPSTTESVHISCG